MSRRALFILMLITLFFGTAYITTKFGLKNDANIVADESFQSSKNEMLDENNEKVLSTSASEVTTTPNTILILKRFYSDWGHTILEKSLIASNMVNLTSEELQEEYSNWKLEKFSDDEVVFSKELESFCGEHYLLTEEEGKILIYSLDEDDNKTLKEETDIAYEYLPETDKILLRSGIYVYGNEELNKIKEDFES